MEDVGNLVGTLFSKDSRAACGALKALLKLCETSNAAYPHFGTFCAMLSDQNSYIRTRGFLLVAACAKWDADRKLDAALDACLARIADEKPIASRQCVKALPQIVRARPDLRETVRAALEAADTSIYPDTTRPLVEADIAEILRGIRAV